jgi:hypothetical protein
VTASAPQRVAALVKRRGAAGAQYVVVRGDRTEVEVCHGMADAALLRPFGFQPQPSAHRLDRRSPQRHRALLTPLAMQVDAGRTVEHDIGQQ